MVGAVRGATIALQTPVAALVVAVDGRLTPIRGCSMGAMIRPFAYLVAASLAASLVMNMRYILSSRFGQDPCPASCARVIRNVSNTSSCPPSSQPVEQGGHPASDGRPDKSFIIVTFCTHGVMDFALNWILHIRELGLPHMVGAMDDQMVEVCKAWSIPHHAVHTDDLGELLTKEGFKNIRGSNLGFAALGVLKTLFVQRMLQEGRDVLISDTDTAWFRDPRPIVYGTQAGYEDFKLADMLISTDCIDATDDESRDNSGCWYTPVQKNTGIIFFKANARSVRFVKDWEVCACLPRVRGGSPGPCRRGRDL